MLFTVCLPHWIEHPREQGFFSFWHLVYLALEQSTWPIIGLQKTLLNELVHISAKSPVLRILVEWGGVFTSCRQGGHLPPLPDEECPELHTGEPEMVTTSLWRTESSSIQAERQLTMEIALASSPREEYSSCPTSWAYCDTQEYVVWD